MEINELIPLIKDDFRGLKLELHEKGNIPNYWVYKIVYFESGEVKEDFVLGETMFDALNRFLSMHGFKK